MSAFRIDLDRIQREISKANLDFALDQLKNVISSSPSEERECLHWQGKILMRQGQFDMAIELFLNTLTKYGNHIGLLLDLAACHYLTGQMYRWAQTLDLAEYELRQSRHLLNFDRLTNCLLLLAKFKEEQGNLNEALELYLENLARINRFALDRDSQIQKLRLRAQILRLSSEHGSTSKFLATYKELNMVNARETSWDCEFELEHALLIFESKYFGLEQARTRFEKLRSNPHLKTAEATLIYTDFIYEVLLRVGRVDLEICNFIQESANLSPYESQVLAIGRGQLPTLLEVLGWPEEMSPGQILRLYVLLRRIFSSISEQELPDYQISKLFKAACANLSAASRKAWDSSFWQGDAKELTDIQNFSLDLDRGTLLFQQGTEPLVLTRSEIELLSIFNNSTNVEFESAVQVLWNGQGDENDLARLRMRISRLNKRACEFWDLASLISMSDYQIKFLGHLKVRNSSKNFAEK